MISKWTAASLFVTLLFGLPACSDSEEDAGAGVDGQGAADAQTDTGESDASGPLEDVPGADDVEGDAPEGLCGLGETRCADTRTLEVCQDAQVGFEAQACPGEQVCQDGACGDGDCTLGLVECVGPTRIQSCEEVDGLPSIIRTDCDEGSICFEASCQEVVCDPNGLPTCLDEDTAVFCDPPGVATREQDCFSGQICIENGCQTQLCVPGTTACRGNTVEVCNELGTAYEPEQTCGDGTRCFEGRCVGECEAANIERSYQGCQYTGLDLPNSSANLANGFGIAVANTSDILDAVVSISTSDELLATLTIAPLSVETFVDTQRNHKLRGSGVFNGAFRVESSNPVVVYQFNSYETIRAASTDGSLLIPDHALFDQYFAMTYSGDQIGSGSEPFIAITAPSGGAEVTITTTDRTKASINTSLRAIPALTPGSTTTLSLTSSFEVILLEAATGTTDLTGTLIEADGPIGVYSGNFATQVPTGRRYRDHIEQQIFPRQALGDRYIVPKSAERGNNVVVPDQLRILADLDGTQITFNPELRPPVTLDAGEFVEVAASSDVEVSSNQPIMIGQFFAGSNAVETNSTGDPTFILQVPIEQFRDNYVFTCPPTYTTDRVVITAPIGASVSLDGQVIELSEEPVAASIYSVTTLIVSDGEHRIIGDLPFGISVYGYGGPPNDDPDRVQNVSYGYPGGLNLNEINPKE